MKKLPSSVIDQIILMVKTNIPYSVIELELDVNRSTISYHAKKHGLNKKIGSRTVVDWIEIKQEIENGKTVSEITKQYCISNYRLKTAFKNGLIPDPHFKFKWKDNTNIENLLNVDTNKYNAHIKRRLLRTGILKEICSECGLGPTWNNKPLVLQLDHINGNNSCNNLDNLRLLCPNCHTQTETFAGRKNKK